ncbi:MAG: Asp23/Gls24 family envelope stress response protein [Clostridiales bacterium]|nr:Asp23/Gls24 family envelope stress response protein [Clostridiales bacterium]
MEENGAEAGNRLAEELAQVRVSEAVIASYAAEAALSVPGVYRLGSGGAVQKTRELLSRGEGRVRGIRVTSEAGGISLDIYLIVEFGSLIPETAWTVQKKIADGLKQSVQIKLKEVNIHIQGVHID